MTSHTARSYAITLAIAITIIGPRVSGFTIDRTENALSTQAPDLTTNESIQLQVKNDLKIPNDSKTSTEKDSATTTKNSIETTIPTVIPITTEKIDKKITTPQPTTVSSTTEFARIPTISSDTVEVFDSVEDTTLYNNSEKIINSTTSNVQQTTASLPNSVAEPVLQTTAKLENNLKLALAPNAPKQPLETVSIIESVGTKINKTENNATIAKTSAQSLEDYKTTTPMLIMTELAFNTTETATISTNANILETISTTVSDVTLTTTNAPVIVSETTNNVIIDIDDIKLPETSTLPNLETTRTATAKIETKFTDPFLDKYTKYTTIVRKRVSSTEETTAKPMAEVEAMKAETSNTLVSFERDVNVTLIPSLDKTRSELMSNINRSLKNDVEIENSSPLDVVESISEKTLESVQTKRAGFLDNSVRVTTPLPSIIAVENTTISEVKKETVKDTFTHIEAMETESPVSKKVTASESQSQLAEYAIQEELLKEEALNMHEENARRYQGSNELFKQINASQGEDPLTVQPIERSKSTIYTVSPNYKPMKKIDVQPAKPFIRDPDDNSWRNESISSLGIVFKPKNSSKSFKEVLKNKTQIELNNLIEKTKDDVPDLRVRLEKIAEVRKTKKKKMNKDGEIVYTDYEESNSAEISTTPKINPISAIFSFDDTSGIITPLRTLTEPKLTTPMPKLHNTDSKPMDKNSTGVQSLFNQNLDQLTTLKSTKFFNAAEYYDTTDEYDIDYVTMSNLDLKKFPVPSSKTTETVPITKPLETYFPERKPTVQYFPPREPQKVNINKPDEEFEKKIKFYTYRDHPMINSRPPFVTLPPLPIATQKPHSEMRMQPQRADNRPDMRPTVRPADFTMYSPADLNKNYYISNTQASTDPQDAFMIDGGNFDRGSYVIKHYRDFLNAAVKDNDEERSSDFHPFHATQAPPPRERELTTEPEKQTFSNGDDEEDYDARFRKEVISRFVDNFNQNSERFKVDFPILYNNSIVHRKGSGAPAASRAFLRSQYHNEVATRGNGLVKKPCEPNCDMTVELSPAYELHYYVPGQEEREEQEQKTGPPAQPYRYSL